MLQHLLLMEMEWDMEFMEFEKLWNMLWDGREWVNPFSMGREWVNPFSMRHEVYQIETCLVRLQQ